MGSAVCTTLVVLFIIGAIAIGVVDTKNGGPQRRAAAKAMADATILCPHCQTAGFVTTKAVRQKKGISGGKATGALLTGGISILATGLSRKEPHTEMCCTNCGVTWYV